MFATNVAATVSLAHRFAVRQDWRSLRVGACTVGAGALVATAAAFGATSQVGDPALVGFVRALLVAAPLTAAYCAWNLRPYEGFARVLLAVGLVSFVTTLADSSDAALSPWILASAQLDLPAIQDTSSSLGPRARLQTRFFWPAWQPLDAALNSRAVGRLSPTSHRERRRTATTTSQTTQQGEHVHTGVRALSSHDAAIRLPVVPTPEDVRARLDPLAAREAIVLAAEDIGLRLDGALACRRILAAEDVRMG